VVIHLWDTSDTIRYEGRSIESWKEQTSGTSYNDAPSVVYRPGIFGTISVVVDPDKIYLEVYRSARAPSLSGPDQDL
jgi:hypothetical protein